MLPTPATDPELSLTEIIAKRDAREAELCRRSLRMFIRKIWPVLEPDREYRHNWHIDVLCDELEALTRGEITREVVNVPPGTMKSLLISVIWPAWIWASTPSAKFLKATYSDYLSVRDNVKLRNIIESPWYQKHYDVELVGDQNQKQMFKTSEGGWSVATSVGGKGTGEHPHYVIIDDPITALDARSKAARDEVINWFTGTISSRGVALDVRVIIVMQRLNEDDLSGHQIAKGARLLKLPMRYEPFRAKTEKDPGNVPDPRDPRTEAGELLWPEVFTEAKVTKLELDLGPYDTAGQLQQRPAPEGGGLFQREWFKFVDAGPTIARRVRGWDTGATAGGGDATAGVRIAEPPGPVNAETGAAEGLGLFYIEDVVIANADPTGVEALMLQTSRADGMGVAQREQREGGSAGKTVTASRARRLLKGFDYAEVIVSHDKVTLSKPLRAQVQAGNVYIVRDQGRGGRNGTGWNEDFIREFCAFPTGKHDDQVDGGTTAFNALVLEPVPQEEWYAL